MLGRQVQHNMSQVIYFQSADTRIGPYIALSKHSTCECARNDDKPKQRKQTKKLMRFVLLFCFRSCTKIQFKHLVDNLHLKSGLTRLENKIWFDLPANKTAVYILFPLTCCQLRRRLFFGFDDTLCYLIYFNFQISSMMIKKLQSH